ncbi:MAG: lipase secretion chaperone [Aquabacterium sp.]
MSTAKWIALSALAGAAVVAVLVWTRPPAPADVSQASATAASGLIQAHVPTPEPAGSEPLPLPGMGQMRAMGASAPSPNALIDSVAPPGCRTTDNGDIVVDADTRGDVEMVVMLYKPEQAMARLDDACQDKGPRAKQAMRNLYQQYVQYITAVKQTWPVEEQTAIPVEKLESTLHKSLHELRVQYFGADKACAMFCEEEELTHRMLTMAVTYKQKNPKATTEEAVGMAQAEIMKEVQAKAAAQEAAAQGK